MPHLTNLQFLFETSWEQTVSAFWNKYPHPKLGHVKESYVLDRKVDSNGILHSTRLIQIEQSVPRIVSKFCDMSSYYALEKSVVDPHRKVLRMETTNLTYDSLIQAKEICEYRPSETSLGKTDYSWTMEVDVSGKVPLFSRQIEKTLLCRAEQNASKGLMIMTEICGNQEPFKYNTNIKAKMKREESENWGLLRKNSQA